MGVWRDLDQALRSAERATGVPRLRHIGGISEHNGQWQHEVYVFSLRTPKGRKDYCCAYCGEDIPKGLRHVTYTTFGEEGPGFNIWRLHGECFLSGGAMFSNDGRPTTPWLGAVL